MAVKNKKPLFKSIYALILLTSISYSTKILTSTEEQLNYSLVTEFTDNGELVTFQESSPISSDSSESNDSSEFQEIISPISSGSSELQEINTPISSDSSELIDYTAESDYAESSLDETNLQESNLTEIAGADNINLSRQEITDNLIASTKKYINFEPVKSKSPWNWDSIDTNQVSFPENFLWGAAVCEYQCSGAATCKDSNWAQWEITSIPGQTPHIEDNQTSGIACDHWKSYKADIDLAKNLGLNSFRFSIDWSKIEPKEGQINEEALQHYDDLCNYLISQNMTPMATLHHFVHPQWFEDKGAFENKKNIKYFKDFAKLVFNRYSSKINLWCTINEPTVYLFQGYLRGVFPPGKKGNIAGALTVLENLLQAHTEVYYELKALPNGQEAQIGIVHQYLMFEPYNKYNFLEKIPGLVNYIMNGILIDYFTNGHVHYKIPFVAKLALHSNSPDGKTPLDFIGLNYYSRALIKSQFSLTDPLIPSCYPNEIMTDMPYAIYAEGLSDAVETIAKIGVPIYITENGIADSKDNRRELFIRRYLYALSNIMSKGYDVRGYYYWTLLDNFEWDMGYKMKFGLYEVDFKTQERKLREGSKCIKEIINSSKPAELILPEISEISEFEEVLEPEIIESPVSTIYPVFIENL